MKKYGSYTVDDFIQDEDFRDWVQGHSDRESFWLSFPEQYPQQQEAFRQAEQFIRAVAVVPERISETDIRKETEQFIQKARSYRPHRSSFAETFRQENRFVWGSRWAMAAAMLVAVVSLGWYITRRSPTQQAGRLPDVLIKQPDIAANQLVETSNDTQQPLRIVLTDSSEVLLSPKSRLRYPAQFAGKSRKVYLTGEASFSVKRRNQPFMVYSGEMVTKVLGTRFVVRAFDVDRKITVQVLSGKVSVYKARSERAPANKEVNGLILYANQAAFFEKSDGNLMKTLVANPALVERASKNAQFVYDEVALPVILRELEKSYGIPIQFDEQSFSGCKITASLPNESLYEKLDILCKAASATYEITDGQLVISRKGYR
ncbi:FecR family protein [Spirosoma areae]